MIRIGVISDTHNYLDPKIGDIFAGVARILHAGDVGLPQILLRLQEVAPVTAVRGNCDSDSSLGEVELLAEFGRKFLLHHIVEPRNVNDPIQRRIARDRPDVVVFGHTHRKHQEWLGDTLYLNPGYAGRPRAGVPRSLAILQVTTGGEIQVEFVPL